MAAATAATTAGWLVGCRLNYARQDQPLGPARVDIGSGVGPERSH